MHAAHWSKAQWDQARWPNFSPQELACKGTGKLLINEDALDRLQALRSDLGVPFLVTSAYRSPEHNRKVGGAKNSMHMQGIAFDIRMDNLDPAEFIAAAQRYGFRGIGTYPASGFIHIDTRAAPARWGDPFPLRTSRFAVETPPVEVTAPKVADSHRAEGVIATIGSALVTDLTMNGGENIIGAAERAAGLPLGLQIVFGLGFAIVVGVLLYRHFKGAPG